MKQLKLILAVSGASGMLYAKRILHKLHLPEIKAQLAEAGVVFSKNVPQIWESELGTFNTETIEFPIYEPNNFYAPFASGSAGYDTMLVVPCSMGTLGRIAGGISNDLITRAADVMLKERKKLILLTREMPFSLIHLENMTRLTRAGALIYPASPHFYHHPDSVNALADTVVDRILEAAGLEGNIERWGGKK